MLLLKYEDEKFGRPQFKQRQEMLLLSMIAYIESVMWPWQSIWYHVLHVSHSSALDFQVTAFVHTPQGHLGVLGPGLSSTWLLIISLIRRWKFLSVFGMKCFLFSTGVLE